MPQTSLAASFRDPSGFLFHDQKGTLCRQVNHCYRGEYDLLLNSGLYAELTNSGLLIEHEECDLVHAQNNDAYKVIRPRLVPLISYPYEWAFSAYQDAALLTLEIQGHALERGLTLKDASAYNVQFIGCRPVFIDSLSFEAYQEGKPWIAYGQFCQHFLAPLMLMAKRDVDLSRLMQLYIGGIPLDLASSLLPTSSKFSIRAQLHIHMHAKMVRKHESTSSSEKASVGSLSKKKQLLLLDNLRNLVKSLKWKDQNTEWGDYYRDNTYTEESARKKKQVVAKYLSSIAPQTAWDLGANTGVYTRLAVEQGAYCCAWDIDPACVESAYQHGKTHGETRMLPLRVDLSNPSPAIGWAHQERNSLAERGPVDVVMGLALIHHLAIANNVPLPSVASYFHRLGKNLILEWVPKPDVQVQRLLQSREDIFDRYDQESFEEAFRGFFEIHEQQMVGNDGRVLYRMAAR